MIKYCTSPCVLVRRVDITIGDEEETLKCLAIDFGLNSRFELP